MSAYRRTTAICAAVLLSALCVLGGTAQAGFTASVNNSTNTTGSGTMFLTATNGTTQCSSVPGGSSITTTAAFPCTGNQFPANVPATGTSSAGDALTASGTSTFKTATYSAQSCAPVRLANTTTSADPVLVRGGVTFAQTGPPAITGSGALGVDGSTALAASVVSTTGLQTFSMGVWFKTSSPSGGLMGFSLSPSAVLGANDRSMYFNAAGNIVFGVYPGVVQTIQSPASYANGAWHYVVGTLSSGPVTSTQTLYVDGAQVATANYLSVGGAGAQVYNGYWRIGQTPTDVAGGWTGNGQYLNGSLSDAAVFPTALSAANVSALYTAGTQAALSTLVTTNGATSFWPLSDTGLQTYSGPFPGGAGNPCAHIRVTVGTAGKCVYPSVAGACPAQASTYLLTGLVAAGTVPLTPSTPAQPQTLTTTASRDTSYNTNFDVGLHLLIPITVTETGFPQAFTWAANKVIV